MELTRVTEHEAVLVLVAVRGTHPLSTQPLSRQKFKPLYGRIIMIISFYILISAGVGPCKLDGVDNVIPMTGSTGKVFSPKFPPGTRPRDTMCTWIITVPEGHFVRFSLTSYKFADSCGNRNTTLEIRDGESSSSDLLKLFCEWPYAEEVFSSNRHLWVRFQSPKPDWTFYFRFSAVFEAVKQRKALSIEYFSSFDHSYAIYEYNMALIHKCKPANNFYQ